MGFKAEQKTISKLLNDSIYYIPINQRKYVWERENWADMFNDLSLSAEGETPHFLGSVVLQKNKKEEGLETFQIIDGQQRMITITILLLSIMKRLKEENCIDDFNGLIKYIEAVDNKNSKHMILDLKHYRIVSKIFEKMKSLETDELQRMTNAAFIKQCGIRDDWERRISSCFDYFYKEFNIKGYTVSQIIGIRDALLNTNYVHIQADTEEDSYTIFEILNARGLELEESELLKNYIMRHMASGEEKEDVKFVWKSMELLLGDNLKNFIKHYAPHVYRTTSEEIRKEPYKLIKLNCKGDSVKKLVADMELKAKYYSKIITPDCFDGKDEECSDIEKKVFSFFKRHRFEQFRPVILSLMHNKESEIITEEKYNEVLLYIYRFIICYNLIGRERSNKLRDTIYIYAPKLERDCSEKNINEFITSLKNKIPNETWFTNVFKNLGWSHKWNAYNDDKSKKNVQLVIAMIEEYWGGIEDSFTIEHILPDSDSEQNALIGNLIPLERRLNEKCNNKSFSEKLEIYQSSRFETTRRFAKVHLNKPHFDPADRTNRLASIFYNEILSLRDV